MYKIFLFWWEYHVPKPLLLSRRKREKKKLFHDHLTTAVFNKNRPKLFKSEHKFPAQISLSLPDFLQSNKNLLYQIHSRQKRSITVWSCTYNSAVTKLWWNLITPKELVSLLFSLSLLICVSLSFPGDWNFFL